jgi:palmitoyl transferase
MKPTLLFLLFILLSPHVIADELDTCNKWPKWFKSVCTQLKDTWLKGNIDGYFTGYAWHNRYLYSKERLSTYNEEAFGGGLGKGFDDKDGDWNGVYAMAFLDSHKNIEPLTGYGFIKTAHFTKNIRPGIGYTIFVTARPDIFKGRPFPGALPLISISYLKFSLFATYIPGAQGAGNVLFCFAKYTF